jgi:hypothetical protein
MTIPGFNTVIVEVPESKAVGRGIDHHNAKLIGIDGRTGKDIWWIPVNRNYGSSFLARPRDQLPGFLSSASGAIYRLATPATPLPKGTDASNANSPP